MAGEFNYLCYKRVQLCSLSSAILESSAPTVLSQCYERLLSYHVSPLPLLALQASPTEAFAT